MTRRRFLVRGAVAGSGIAALPLVGCGEDDESTSTPGTTTSSGASPSTGTASASASPDAKAVKRGGQVVLSVGASGAQPMDPHTSLNKAFTYWGLIGDRFLNPDPKTVIPLSPALVEAWEQPDASTIILTARQGAKWHEGKTTNGRAFTADDIAYNLNRIAGKFDAARIGLFQRASLLAGLDKTEVVDGSKVKVTLSRPNAAFLMGLADFRQYAVAKEQVDKDPDFQQVANFSGTGPFIVQTYDDSSSTGTYDANKAYWRTGEPYVDKIKQVQLVDSTAAAAAFVSKQVALAAMNVNNEPIIKAGRSDYKRVSWEHSGWDYFRLNQKRGQFTDPRVRKAIHLAINREELGDTGYGPGNWDYTGLLPSGFPGAFTADEIKKLAGFNPSTKAADIAEGLKLLEAAGFPKGKGVSFVATPSATGKLHDDVIRIKDQLDKAYPDMNVTIKEPADAAEFAKNLGTGEYDAINYVSFPAPDAGLEANQHFGLTGARNYTKYNNPEVEALIQKTFSELDTRAREAAIREIQQKLQDDVFAIATNKNRPLYAVDNKLDGFDGVHGPGTAGAYDVQDYARLLWLS